jgi:hypothetical protein
MPTRNPELAIGSTFAITASARSPAASPGRDKEPLARPAPG